MGHFLLPTLLHRHRYEAAATSSLGEIAPGRRRTVLCLSIEKNITRHFPSKYPVGRSGGDIDAIESLNLAIVILLPLERFCSDSQLYKTWTEALLFIMTTNLAGRLRFWTTSNGTPYNFWKTVFHRPERSASQRKRLIVAISDLTFPPWARWFLSWRVFRWVSFWDD